MTRFLEITFYLALFGLFFYLLGAIPKSEVQICKETYRVYSCSLKPDYSAFTQPTTNQGE